MFHLTENAHGVPAGFGGRGEVSEIIGVGAGGEEGEDGCKGSGVGCDGVVTKFDSKDRWLSSGGQPNLLDMKTRNLL